MTTIDVEILNAPNLKCDEFVKNHKNGKICHLFLWNHIVAEIMGLTSYYLSVKIDNEIHGVLPLMRVNSRIFGNRMISAGMSTYGGILAISKEAEKILYDKAVEIATKLNCESIEFRNVQALPYELTLRSGKLSMHLPLFSDPDQIWKSLDPKVRNQVRKAEKSNISICDGGIDLLKDFYDVYTIRMRQLGTPCYPINIMNAILSKMPDYSRIFIAKLGNVTVGGGFTICFNGFAEIPWAATLVEYNSFCPNNLLYWSVIKYYCLLDAKIFDFGRCTIDGPTYKFKKQWDPTPVELFYQYWSSPAHKANILSPDNPKFKRKVEIWKRMPLWLTRVLGPKISRNLP